MSPLSYLTSLEMKKGMIPKFDSISEKMIKWGEIRMQEANNVHYKISVEENIFIKPLTKEKKSV